MKEVNIKRTGPNALQRTIDNECGGYYKGDGNTFLVQQGIGSLRYRESDQTVLNVYVQRYNNGLGIKFRNLDHHKLLLVPEKEIDTISLIKKPDLISPRKKSLMMGALNRKWQYRYAKIFAFEDELIEEPVMQLGFRFFNDHELILECRSSNPSKFIDFFMKTEFSNRFKYDVADYKLVF